MTTILTSEYKDKIGNLLIDLPVDSVFVISEKVKPENRDLFIGIVKSYIDRNIGNQEEFQIEFNSDYSKIRKTHYFSKKNINEKYKT